MIIAKRTMRVRSSDRTIPVEIRLYLPEAADHLFLCRYQIDWPEGTIESMAQGSDMMEAIHLALQKIGTEMYMSRYHHEGSLYWTDGWQGYNFPMPKNGRDLLIGDDQRFFGLDNT
jgi:hypothetical protein